MDYPCFLACSLILPTFILSLDDKLYSHLDSGALPQRANTEAPSDVIRSIKAGIAKVSDTND